MIIYPGTFDPVTNGHIDLMERGQALFGRLVVAIAIDTNKKTFFSAEERQEMIIQSTQHIPDLEVVTFKGLLAEFAKEKKVRAILRGLRVISDFEYELQLVSMNRHLNPALETIFMMPSQEYAFLNSSSVKEIAALGGNLLKLVPEPVIKMLKLKGNYIQEQIRSEDNGNQR